MVVKKVSKRSYLESHQIWIVGPYRHDDHSCLIVGGVGEGSSFTYFYKCYIWRIAIGCTFTSSNVIGLSLSGFAIALVNE